MVFDISDEALKVNRVMQLPPIVLHLNARDGELRLRSERSLKPPRGSEPSER